MIIPSCIKKLFYAFTGFVLLLVSNQLFAQAHAEELTLSIALQRTLANSPHLHQYSFRRQNLYGQRGEASQSPELDLSFTAENMAGSGVFKGSGASELTLALSSVLELGGKRHARTAVADARLQALNYQLEAETLDVLGRVTIQFIRVLTTQESIVLAHEALALSQETLSLVRSRSTQGAAPETEIKRATAALALSQIHLDELRHQLKRQRVSLAFYWGQQSLSFTSLKGSLFEFNAIESFPQLYLRVQSSPAMSVFASNVRLQRAKLQLARSQSKVGVRWQAGLKRFEDTGDTAVVAGVEVPLFSGKRNKYSVQSAIASRDQAIALKKINLLELHERLHRAHSYREQYVNKVNKIQTLIIPALEDALQLTLVAYENGRSSYQDWMTAQRELLTAKQGLIDGASLVLENQAIIEQLIAEQF